MPETTIRTWAVTIDRDGGPIIACDPTAEQAADALVLVQVDPAARRYCLTPVGVTDPGFAARLACEAIARAFPGGGAWARVRPADLVLPHARWDAVMPLPEWP